MKLKVAVIFGGESVEHEISVISAVQAIHSLDKNKYEVIPVYISKKREMYTGSILNDISNFKNINTMFDKLKKVYFVNDNGVVKLEPVKKGLFSKTISVIDVVLPIVHGTNGEDGVLQGYLEMLNIPYTSSDVIASAVGQDKVVMKCVLENAKIDMTDWFWIYGFEVEEKIDEIKDKANKIGYPLIIKPACLGSSIGIEFAENFDELLEAIDKCSKYDNKIVIEHKLNNFREVNCSVLGSIYKAKTSVLEEVSKGEFLDFSRKYISKSNNKMGMASLKRDVPAKLNKNLENKVKEVAIKTFNAIGSHGVCRIDFLIDENERVLVNEINNIPGSLSFYLWKHEGVEYKELLDELIEGALNRANKKQKMIFSYQSNVLEGYNGIKGSKGSKQ